MKIQTEDWYNSNIGNNTTYASKVADGKFCNDRNTASGYTWASQPSSTFYYAARGRLESAKTPTLECPSGDVYTLKAGAITADEVSFAGGVYGTANDKYYLYNNQYYWTMSPYYWCYYSSSSRYAYVFYVGASGRLYNSFVYDANLGVRPVINLKSDTIFSSGDGTLNNPYIVAD